MRFRQNNPVVVFITVTVNTVHHLWFLSDIEVTLRRSAQKKHLIPWGLLCTVEKQGQGNRMDTSLGTALLPKCRHIENSLQFIPIIY